ncbi:hypothetical protein VINI7043_06061 [Vibrio nigripulchritudo ATCC 27043]|uniref:hypothetical protein n=1 Tax=Vibrio nigripulchritudo TaxID=28173 RepID=UPI00021C2A57|nr:hypothetical protein [Vibrio nigripulchritudo]EGU57180.1 hypothetical protein VINI7043_06061 [Vibrio nigripulchritudo ATCC 27043]KJY79612.1 hypothetical protein TW74_09230 [Vibrio nigripulchritudo]BCL71718.1 hypothetical protein VNTUMSATTG_36550 [Vibrio nigripulchritudo]BDU33076.1 hypothetical protein TUMSATVNIG1_36850 [Vibrio nigripulchritudo]
MPKVYCEACEKKTHHKAIMCKTTPQCTTLLEKANQLMFQVFNGDHYHKMEQRLYCRVCNHEYREQPVTTEIKETSIA